MSRNKPEPIAEELHRLRADVRQLREHLNDILGEIQGKERLIKILNGGQDDEQ
jgi:CHAD domain-containing protein